VVLVTLNVVGAIYNAQQSAKYFKLASEANNVCDAVVGTGAGIIHLGLAFLNLYGFKCGLGPPPAGGAFATAGGNALENTYVALASNPALRAWVWKQLYPVLITGTTFFASKFGPHDMDWQHRDERGKKIESGEETSGSDVPPGRRLSWPEQLKTHTEYKVLSQILPNIRPGHTVTFQGELGPCDGCARAMAQVAIDYDVTIIYAVEGCPIPFVFAP
jgi:hypothetical protein